MIHSFAGVLGRTRYLEIPGMGHDFTRVASQREYLTRNSEPRPYEWLDEQLKA